MIGARSSQISQIEYPPPAIGGSGQREAALFANLRQGEGPKIFEKTGIGHRGPLGREALGRYFFGAGAGGAFRFTLKLGIFWFSRLMASAVMSKPLALANTTACLSSTRWLLTMRPVNCASTGWVARSTSRSALSLIA